MKADVATDAESGLAHKVRDTAGNVNDAVECNSLLRGAETEAWADAGCRGTANRPDTKPGLRCNIAMRQGERKQLDLGRLSARLTDKLKRTKASIQAMLGHTHRINKRRFGHVNLSYRAVATNTAHLHARFALPNQWVERRHLAGGGA